MPGVPRQTNTTHFWKREVYWHCRLRRQGQQNLRVLKMCVFVGRGTPSLKKNTWPKNNFGIPRRAALKVKSRKASREPRKTTTNPKNPENLRTLPRPQRFVYQSPYRTPKGQDKHFKLITHRIRTAAGPKLSIFRRKWASGPSPGRGSQDQNTKRP